MAAKLGPSRWLTASCTVVIQTTVTHQYEGETREGPDRQTARLAPCLSCQNRQQTQEYLCVRPFCLSFNALICKAFFLSVIVIHQSHHSCCH